MRRLDRETIQKRLILALYGLGTNTGLKRISAGNHGENYQDLLYIRRKFINKDNLRNAISNVVNAILNSRLTGCLGRGNNHLCLRFKEVWCMGPEPFDRMAYPLSWEWSYDLLACRKKLSLYIFPAKSMFIL